MPDNDTFYKVKVYKHKKEKDTGDWLLRSDIQEYVRKPSAKMLSKYSLVTGDAKELLVWYVEHMLFGTPSTAIVHLQNTSLKGLHSALHHSLQKTVDYLSGLVEKESKECVPSDEPQ